MISITCDTLMNYTLTDHTLTNHTLMNYTHTNCTAHCTNAMLFNALNYLEYTHELHTHELHTYELQHTAQMQHGSTFSNTCNTRTNQPLTNYTLIHSTRDKRNTVQSFQIFLTHSRPTHSQTVQHTAQTQYCSIFSITCNTLTNYILMNYTRTIQHTAKTQYRPKKSITCYSLTNYILTNYTYTN